jgi:hypothetical protein
MLDKFQKLFDDMGSEEKVSVKLDLYEVSTILSLIKADEVYTKSLEENLLKMFDKVKK